MRESDATSTRSQPCPPGWTIEHVASTGSTNADLLAVAAARPDRSVLVAGHQTAGRGRLDRRWDAPPGTNLLASLLFHVVPASAFELTRRVGLAAITSAEEVAGVRAGLKWPNDVTVGDAKLAGILAQRSASGPVVAGPAGPAGPVVVGIGLNVRWAPAGAARLGAGIDVLAVLAALLAAYDRLPGDIGELYRRQLTTLGQDVRVELPGGVLEGTAVDTDRDGRLVVVDASGAPHHLDVGDVIHVRGAHVRRSVPPPT